MSHLVYCVLPFALHVRQGNPPCKGTLPGTRHVNPEVVGYLFACKNVCSRDKSLNKFLT